MIKKTKTLYSIAKKWQDKIFVIKDVIVKYDDQVDTGIDEQIKTIEKGYGGGCVWNNTYLAMDMCNEHNIADNEKYGFEENLKIMMGMNSEVEIIADKPGEMTTSLIMHMFERNEEECVKLAFRLFLANNKTEPNPNPDDMIEAEHAEIMELMECRRIAKKMMFRYSSDSDMYKKAKDYVIELKKEINRRFTMYDRKCGIDEQEDQKET